MDNLACLNKAINLLNILSAEPYSFNVTELSNISGLNRTTVYRILSTLEESRIVIKNENTKDYKIGPTIYHLGCTYLNNFNCEDQVPRILNEISKQTEESVGYAIREGDTVLSLYEIEINQPLKMNYKPGLYYPMNRGCYGKCLMAYYDADKVKELLYKQKFEKIADNTLTEPEEIFEEYKKIREQGYVISKYEVSPYALGVGIPVFNTKGIVKACVAVSFIKGSSGKSDEERINEFLYILKSYSAEFTRYIP
jgi:DNA-binding IclR family transcriptional regulator